MLWRRPAGYVKTKRVDSASGFLLFPIRFSLSPSSELSSAVCRAVGGNLMICVAMATGRLVHSLRSCFPRGLSALLDRWGKELGA